MVLLGPCTDTTDGHMRGTHPAPHSQLTIQHISVGRVRFIAVGADDPNNVDVLWGTRGSQGQSRLCAAHDRHRR